MAKLTYQAAHPSISGVVGDVVYRRRNGQAEMARRPKKPAVGWSEKQEANRNRFSVAAAYARDVLADPIQAERYAVLAAAAKRSVMSILVADYCNPPTIERIDDRAYRGQAGDLLRVIATDDLEVIAVRVTLRDLQGALLEEGPATKVHDVWNYTAQTTPPPNQPVSIEAIAWDRPRHQGKGSKVWVPMPGSA